MSLGIFGPQFFRRVEKLDENGIFNLTGCLSSCKKDEFEIAEQSELATFITEGTVKPENDLVVGMGTDKPGIF